MFDMVPFRRNNNVKGNDAFGGFMDSFFNNDFFSPLNLHGFGKGFKADIKETDNSYLVEADLPGIKKDAISVDYNNNYLTISAKREDSKEEKDENFLRRERSYGEFRRSFYVDDIDKNSINASFENGVLKIDLPKSQNDKNNDSKIDIK